MTGSEFPHRPLGQAGPASEAPTVRGKYVRVRPPRPEDFGAIYGWATSEEGGYRWRYRGSTPQPDDVVRLMWRQALVVFVVESLEKRDQVGVVSAYDPDFVGGTCYFQALYAPEYQGSGWPLEGLALLVEYVFRCWPLRKMYADIPEFNTDLLESAFLSTVREEGRLRKHGYYNGRYWDQITLALYREDWELVRSNYLGCEPRRLSDDTKAGALSYDEFCAALLCRLNLDVGNARGIQPTASLQDYLGLDSLQRLELVMFLEDSGVHLPDDLIGELQTLGDVYHYYQALLST